jgi:hypothetical protein
MHLLFVLVLKNTSYGTTSSSLYFGTSSRHFLFISSTLFETTFFCANKSFLEHVCTSHLFKSIFNSITKNWMTLLKESTPLAIPKKLRKDSTQESRIPRLVPTPAVRRHDK